jgi:predicted nucleotidyltransferase component of viral defense system
MKNILTKKQQLFLNLFSKTDLNSKFYLTGGTALTGFYMPFRLSEDLDFFSLEEISPEEIVIFFKKIKNILKFKNFEYNTSFNRNLFFIKFEKETLKTEFSYYPFTQIEKPKKINGIFLDSLIDIATNKLFTIYQKPRARDFIDLYMICTKKNWQIKDLSKNVRLKFDTHIDPVKLGSQLLLCEKVKDYPRILIALPEKKWQKFFLDEAKKLGKDILK